MVLDATYTDPRTRFQNALSLGRGARVHDAATPTALAAVMQTNLSDVPESLATHIAAHSSLPSSWRGPWLTRCCPRRHG